MIKIKLLIANMIIHLCIFTGIYSFVDFHIKSKAKEDHFEICLKSLNTLLRKTETYDKFTKDQKDRIVLVLLAGRDYYSIDYKDVLSIIATESDFRARITHKNKNGSYDYGLTQVNSPYLKYRYEQAKKVLKRYNLSYTNSIYDIHTNVMSAYVYLNDINKSIKKENNYRQFIVAYNVGITGSTYSRLEDKMNSYFERFMGFRKIID